MSLLEKAGPEPRLGEPDETGGSPVKVDYDTPHPAVKSDIEERQAVEAKPMRHVLSIGIAMTVVPMVGVRLMLR